MFLMDRVRLPPLPAFIVLYGAMYSAFGVASPFWPLFFESRGLSPNQLGLLLALGTLARLLVGPLAGRIADRLGALRAVLAVCTALAVAAALSLLLGHGFSMLLAISICQAAALAPITTLADALAVNAAARRSAGRSFEYGWVRGAGSAAFVAGTLLAGQALAFEAELSIIVWIHAALLSGAIAAAALIPGISTDAAARPVEASVTVGALRELLSNRSFRVVIAVSALVFGSHAMHDAFAVIRWTNANISPATASLLWSEAVAAEVMVFFALGPLLLNRIGPKGAAALAVAASVTRWLVMSQTADIMALALIQPLHGLTFALLHLACMRVIGSVVPPQLAATAQAVYAFGAALTSAILSYVSGRLYGEFGATGFLAMAMLCALALPLALAMPSKQPLATSR
jgi:MFS transporter, PPP family, 3-phenylpropionic acid transporter